MHRIFQISHEERNEIDGEMHTHCKECDEKKHKTFRVASLEEEESLDANKNNIENTNERNATIANEKHVHKHQMRQHCTVAKMVTKQMNNEMQFFLMSAMKFQKKRLRRNMKNKIWNYQKGSHVVTIVKLMIVSKMMQVKMFLNRCNSIMMVTIMDADMI